MHACVATGSVGTAIDAYENLGKTHFILGYTPETIPKAIKERATYSANDDAFNFVCDDGSIKHVFFMPDDHVQNKLLQLIKAEKESIKITAYAFTNDAIAQELASAAKKGIAVVMVIDPNVLQDSYSKIETVIEADIPVFVYNPQYVLCLDKASKDKSKKKKKITRPLVTLMHHKFIIFGNNIANKKLLVTGSSNLTVAALRPRKTTENQEDLIGNQENVLLTDERRFIEKYEAQFETLQRRSKPYEQIESAVGIFKRR